MKPKPFWPLNHFTVPVGISLLQSAHAQNSRDHHATKFNFDDVSGRKGARRRIQQGTAANRMLEMYTLLRENTRAGQNRFASRYRPFGNEIGRCGGPNQSV